MKDTKPSNLRRQPVVLPNDACPTCGTLMLPSTDVLSLIVNGERIPVSGVAHLLCPACGEGMLDADAARQSEVLAVEGYREAHALLGSEEIRAIRRELGLQQAELANLLQLGANTLSRWESGRVAQTAAMDVLLRLVRDVPGTVAYLRKRAA